MYKEIIEGLQELGALIQRGVSISDSEPLTEKYANLCQEAAEALAQLSKGPLQ